MIHKIKGLLCIIAILITSQIHAQSVVYYVAPNQADCASNASKKCFLIKKNIDAAYSIFSSDIEGFYYEAGFEYIIRVQITAHENPPVGVPAATYKLIEILDKRAAMPINTDFILEHKWMLSKMQINNVLTKQSKSKAFISFGRDLKVNGFNSCNNFFGGFKQKENTLVLESLGSTKMFCEGSIEEAFMAHLAQVTTYKIAKKSLFLYHENTLLMVFTKAK
ncbi:MAG: META domain-containing protein [Bacteroidota bacterium]